MCEDTATLLVEAQVDGRGDLLPGESCALNPASLFLSVWSQIKHGILYGGRMVQFTKAELLQVCRRRPSSAHANHRRRAPDKDDRRRAWPARAGLQAKRRCTRRRARAVGIAHRARQALRPEYNTRSAMFIYPNETVKGG